MRKGSARSIAVVLAAMGILGSGRAWAQAPGTMAGPIFQDQLNRLDLRGYTPRLTAMGGIFLAVDDANNQVNAWSLDRNPAALIEDFQVPNVQLYGTQDKPILSYLPLSSGARYDQADTRNRFFGALGQAKYRNRVAAEAQVSYRAFSSTELAGEGLKMRSEGNGPRFEFVVNQRIQKVYYGFSVSAYNMDESQQYVYDTTLISPAGIAEILDRPQLKTDRVAYHSVVETAGLQFEIMDGLHVGGTLGFDQQRIDGANSNQRAQLDAINNRNMTRVSLDGTYHYRDRLSVSGRWFHTGYDNTETFRFSRRRRVAVQDPAVIYEGKVSDNTFRTHSFNGRGMWKISPRYLQLGFTYANGKDEYHRTAANGLGSYNYMDSIYLANTSAAESLGVTASQLVDDGVKVTDYVQWGVGAQLHPFSGATLGVDFTRYTAALELSTGPRSPEVKSVRAGAEYRVTPQVALRAGYVTQTENDDRNNFIDKRQGHQLSFGLGYSVPERLDLDFVYVSGNLKSDFVDPSQREVREQGLRLYGRKFF